VPLETLFRDRELYLVPCGRKRSFPARNLGPGIVMARRQGERLRSHGRWITWACSSWMSVRQCVCGGELSCAHQSHTGGGVSQPMTFTVYVPQQAHHRDSVMDRLLYSDWGELNGGGQYAWSQRHGDRPQHRRVL